jgi:hypothetical protein
MSIVVTHIADIQVILVARTPLIGELVEQCALGQISFDELCKRVAAMGYKTTSLYEMVAR